MVHSRYRSLEPSGENNVVDQELSILAAAGHDVELFERQSDDIEGWSLPRKAALPALTLWNPGVHRALGRRLERSCPDVVHVHNTFPLVSASALYACRDAGAPVVTTLHNYRLLCASGDFFRGGRLCHDCASDRGLSALVHGCYRGSRLATAPVVAAQTLHRRAWQELVSAYILLSANQRDLMRDLGLPSERVFVKHNLVRPGQPGPRKPEHIVVYMGRLVATKGVPFLMCAWDAFRRLEPASNLRLVIAGDGPLGVDVQAWAATRPSVDVVGLLPQANAASLLQRAVAVVVPSQWEETFGLVAAEAMAAGVAPIAPARGSFPELITPDVDGVLFDPDDPSGLARAFRDVDREPERFIRYGEEGRTTYARRFHPTPNLDELLAVYQFAIRNPVTGRAARR